MFPKRSFRYGGVLVVCLVAAGVRVRAQTAPAAVAAGDVPAVRSFFSAAPGDADEATEQGYTTPSPWKPARPPGTSSAPVTVRRALTVPATALPMQAVLATGRTDEERVFLASILLRAFRAERERGVPAAVLVAMAALESDYGQSELAALHHNPFAVPSRPGDAAPSVVLSGRAGSQGARASYRDYADDDAGMNGFLQVLSDPKYAPVVDEAIRARQGGGPVDSLRFVGALVKAGYGHERDYLSRFAKIYHRHQLWLLDERSVVPNLEIPGTVAAR